MGGAPGGRRYMPLDVAHSPEGRGRGRGDKKHWKGGGDEHVGLVVEDEMVDGRRCILGPV